MDNDILKDVRKSLNNLSEIERQIHLLKDQLVSLLLDSYTTDTQQDDAQINTPIGEAPPNIEESKPSETALRKQVDLEQWLQARNITIKKKQTENPYDASFDRLANFLGKHYDSLQPFYSAVKKRINGAALPQTLSLKGSAPSQIGITIQFGQELYKNDLLSSFKYDKSNRQVHFDPQVHGHVKNFFTGGWLERYVLMKAKTALSRPGKAQKVESLKNARVLIPPNNQEIELDVLIGNSDVILWFECKTGKNYSAFARKYNIIAKNHMKLPPIHCALVLLEPLTKEEKRNIPELAGISVINLSDFDQFLKNAIACL